MRMHSYTCTEAIVVKLLFCYLFPNVVFNNCFILMMPYRRTRRSAGHSSKGITSRSENATQPVSTTLQTQSSCWTDSTSGVGSARPPVKRQWRNQPTSQSPKDAAGRRPLTAQDVPTIVQAILDALPSQTRAPHANAIQRCWSGAKSGHFQRRCS